MGAKEAEEQERDLAERFRIELRYFAHHVRGLGPTETEKAIETLTEHFVDVVSEYSAPVEEKRKGAPDPE